MSLFSFLPKNLKLQLISLSLGSLFLASGAQATTVQFQTVMGNIEVNLFDKTTPETVKNFLSYVNSGAYNNTLIHRSVTITNADGTKRPFVIQGGGYTYPNKLPLVEVKSKGTIINEPVYSNLRGTLAMAKLSGEPNSASKEWYFNLHNDNAVSLDPNLNKSEGYTVFGQVTEASLPVLDAIVAQKTFIISASGLTDFPLRNYTVDDYINNAPVDEDNLVLITNVVVLNASPDTADGLNPVKNTLLVKDDGKGGGGSLALWQLLLLVLLGLSCVNSLFYKQKSLRN